MIGGMSLKSLLARLRAYIDHDDPLVATANLVCLVVASNLPFYPVYHFALLGWDGWPSLLEAPVGLVFLSFPWVSRRSGLLGRALLVVFGTANAIFAMKIMGEASGNALFLAPCVMVAALSFRGSERWVMLSLIWLPVAAFLLTMGRLGDPLSPFTDAENAAMLRLNAVSAGIFVGFLGVLYGRSGTESARASR
jgi:hypothetical protein